MATCANCKSCCERCKGPLKAKSGSSKSGSDNPRSRTSCSSSKYDNSKTSKPSKQPSLFRKIISTIAEEIHQQAGSLIIVQKHEREKEEVDKNKGKSPPEYNHRSRSSRNHNRHLEVSRTMGPNPNITKIMDSTELSIGDSRDERKVRSKSKLSSEGRREHRNDKSAASSSPSKRDRAVQNDDPATPSISSSRSYREYKRGNSFRAPSSRIPVPKSKPEPQSLSLSRQSKGKQPMERIDSIRSSIASSPYKNKNPKEWAAHFTNSPGPSSVAPRSGLLQTDEFTITRASGHLSDPTTESSISESASTELFIIKPLSGIKQPALKRSKKPADDFEPPCTDYNRSSHIHLNEYTPNCPRCGWNCETGDVREFGADKPATICKLNPTPPHFDHDYKPGCPVCLRCGDLKGVKVK